MLVAWTVLLWLVCVGVGLLQSISKAANVLQNTKTQKQKKALSKGKKKKKEKPKLNTGVKVRTIA